MQSYEVCFLDALRYFRNWLQNQPNARVLEWIDSVDADGVYISVITVGEMTKGIKKLPNSKRRQNYMTGLKMNY